MRPRAQQGGAEDLLYRIFFSSSGTLYAPWKIVAFLLATVGALIVSATILGPLISWLYRAFGLRGLTSQWWIESFALLGGTVLCLHAIDKRSLAEVWMDRRAARPSLLAFGFGLGALAIAVPIVILIAVGWLRDDHGGAGSWPGATLRISLDLLPAALREELLTRGYILAVLRRWWGWTWAIFATSVGFGLLHLTNNGATAGSVALVTLAGFFLAGVLYATQSLYAAWMAHFAWNWTMAAVFHSTVSGYPFESPAYRYVDAGPDWATGGEWGPEGGIPAAASMLAALAFLFITWRKRRWPNEWP
jgi:membrane protease YdiL (CAAX protease family)